MAFKQQNPVIGYHTGHGEDFTAHCLDCSKKGLVSSFEFHPIFAQSYGDFEGSPIHCYDCGKNVFDARDEDEHTERRREYHDDIRADFRRLGLR